MSDQQRALDDWWAENDLPEFLADVKLSGFCAGHTFVKLFFDDETGAPESEGDSELVGKAKIALLDPTLMTVFWDARQASRPLWYRMAWQSGDSTFWHDMVPNWLLPADVARSASFRDGLRLGNSE